MTSLMETENRSEVSRSLGRLDRIDRTVFAGWSILALFFGFFGLWSVIAPMNAAVVAKAVVSVDGNRKSVQHLDGGIIKELRVKEGDQVSPGDVLVVLDETQVRAEFEVLDRTYVLNRIIEERLRAEASGAARFDLPEELAKRSGDPVVSSVLEAESAQLKARIEAVKARRDVIREKIAQLESKIDGDGARAGTATKQLELVRGELESLSPLLGRGLITRDKILRLEREQVGLEGSITELATGTAASRQAIAEQHRAIAQIDADRLADVSQQLRETQAKLLDVLPRLVEARSRLDRTVIRSPYGGRVVALTAFSIGGVIGRGERILDVVPEEDRLVIKAQVGVDDISELTPGMAARVRLALHKQKFLPPLTGSIRQISADRFTDERTGMPYYLVEIVLDPQAIEQKKNLPLHAGMAATVIVTTHERTAMDYLIGPLIASFDAAFTQL